MPLESDFKRQFKKRFATRMEELGVSVEILDNKSQRRSTLDTIFLGPRVWAALEFKRARGASKQPNQPYYVKKWNQMSYAAIVYPENQEEIFNELEKLFTV